jgi:hypothetical protein
MTLVLQLPNFVQHTLLGQAALLSQVAMILMQGHPFAVSSVYIVLAFLVMMRHGAHVYILKTLRIMKSNNEYYIIRLYTQ